MKYLNLIAFMVLLSVPALAQNQSSDGETVRLSPAPKMRPIDRDWEYFKQVACERINDEVFHSRSEEMLLAKRKAQCSDKYKAFFNQPLER